MLSPITWLSHSLETNVCKQHVMKSWSRPSRTATLVFSSSRLYFIKAISFILHTTRSADCCSVQLVKVRYEGKECWPRMLTCGMMCGVIDAGGTGRALLSAWPATNSCDSPCKTTCTQTVSHTWIVPSVKHWHYRVFKCVNLRAVASPP